MIFNIIEGVMEIIDHWIEVEMIIFSPILLQNQWNEVDMAN